VFTAEEFYNADTGRYEFHGNVKINVSVSIFKKSVFFKGYQIVKGNQIVKGDQTVEGNQIVKGYQIVEGNQIVKGDQTVEGYQIVEGNQIVKGDQTVEGGQTVEGCKLLKPRGSITINHIGSRNAATTFYFTTDSGVMVRCGCKFLPVADFEQTVKSTHGDNQFAREYQYAIEYAKNMDAYYRGLR
jgi:hypothetical protein